MRNEDIKKRQLHEHVVRNIATSRHFAREKYIVDLEPGNYRVRIYGNKLGTSRDIILLLKAIEKNYITILAHENLIELFNASNEAIDGKTYYNLNGERYSFLRENHDRLMQHYEKYEISDMISPDDYPIITKINFNSPGWWEVIGKWNIFEQLRKYLKERHERKKDIAFEWEVEKQKSQVEIESIQLSNDLLKLEITQNMIKQLKTIGLTDIEIRHFVQKCYGNLYLLNPHIDEGRIVDIKIVDINEDKI